MPNQHLTVADAAERLGCDVRTIHRMIRDGRLRGRKVYDGLRAPYLVNRRDVEKLEAQRSAA